MTPKDYGYRPGYLADFDPRLYRFERRASPPWYPPRRRFSALRAIGVDALVVGVTVLCLVVGLIVAR